MRKKKRKRVFLRSVFGLLLFLGLIAGIVFLVWTRDLPEVSVLKTQYPVFLRGTQEIRFQKNPPRLWVSLENVSEIAVHAIRLSEDWGFFGHRGIDFHEIKESVKKNLLKGRYARGASTITQQLARNVFLTPEKSLRRKVREIVLARKMERELSKDRILEMYLNVVEWGIGIRGIVQASQLYFEKAPRFLNAKEGAFLAMLLPSPHRYSSSFREGELTPYARKTIRSILRKLFRAGYLTEEAWKREQDRPLGFELEKDELEVAPFYESKTL